MRPDITYAEAVREALDYCLDQNDDVFVFGEGVPDPKRIFNTTAGLLEKYGSRRVMDMPLSENALTGVCIGTALLGMRPVMVHQRTDFAYLALDQIINNAAKWNYMFNGQSQVPIVIRMMVGRGWGQGPQHSSSPQALFSHIPGLKVIMPTTPKDAKGMLIAAIRDTNPVLMLEHRWLYWQEGQVPDDPYTVPLEGSSLLKEGSDLTIVATSWMNVEAFRASEILEKIGISVEIVDVRVLSPLNPEVIINSVKKTGHCIIADNDWSFCGYSAELAAVIGQKCFGKLKKPIERIGFAFTPCPTVRSLENEFYPNAINIIRSVEEILGLSQTDLAGQEFYSHEKRFKGPF